MTSPLDQSFIDAQQLVERYLDGKLPYQGARELENWCRAHPEYLRNARLAERTVAALKLLEAGGSPQDLAEPRVRWWKTPQALIGAGLVGLAALIACAVLAGKLNLVRGQLEDAQLKLRQDSLAPPGLARSLHISPDRSAGVNAAILTVDHNAAQLLDLSVNMAYSPEKRFRVTIDKRDQARVLILGDVAKDSNGDLRITFNTSALRSGLYDVRIQALPQLGTPTDAGWLIIDVR